MIVFVSAREPPPPEGGKARSRIVLRTSHLRPPLGMSNEWGLSVVNCVGQRVPIVLRIFGAGCVCPSARQPQMCRRLGNPFHAVLDRYYSGMRRLCLPQLENRFPGMLWHIPVCAPCHYRDLSIPYNIQNKVEEGICISRAFLGLRPCLLVRCCVLSWGINHF